MVGVGEEDIDEVVNEDCCFYRIDRTKLDWSL